MYFYLCVFFFIVIADNLFGSNSTGRMELSVEEKKNLFALYDGKAPWQTIKEYLQERNISINAPFFLGEKPLVYALNNDRIDVTNQLLDEDGIDIDSIDSTYRETLLHSVVRKACNITESTHLMPYMTIMQKLIQKGCPVNALNRNQKTALSLYNGIEWKEYLPTLIENGALLMVKDNNNCCNILDRYLYNVFWPVPNKRISKCDTAVKGLLYSKCKYDYKNYRTWEDCFMMILIFSRLKKEKKVVMPKMLVKYMVTFIDPCNRASSLSPVAHIEDALKNVWEILKIQDHTIENIEKNLSKSSEVCFDLIKHTAVGAWSAAWNAFLSGDMSKSNLIVRALTFDCTLMPYPLSKHTYDKSLHHGTKNLFRFFRFL